MKCSTVKLRKSQRKTNYTRQNENSLDSLACVTMLDYDSTLVIVYSKSKLEAISDSSTFCISFISSFCITTDEFC